MAVVDDDGNVDCRLSPNWWRCPCDKANWNTSNCRKCGYSRIWGDEHIG